MFQPTHKVRVFDPEGCIDQEHYVMCENEQAWTFGEYMNENTQFSSIRTNYDSKARQPRTFYYKLGAYEHLIVVELIETYYDAKE